MLIVYRLALSAVTATFGTAFAKWFFTTKIGVWVQQKFEQFEEEMSETEVLTLKYFGAKSGSKL